jgi:hypothetical protein
MSVPCPNPRCVNGRVKDHNGSWWDCYRCGGRGVVPDPKPDLEGGDRVA